MGRGGDGGMWIHKIQRESGYSTRVAWARRPNPRSPQHPAYPFPWLDLGVSAWATVCRVTANHARSMTPRCQPIPRRVGRAGTRNRAVRGDGERRREGERVEIGRERARAWECAWDRAYDRNLAGHFFKLFLRPGTWGKPLVVGCEVLEEIVLGHALISGRGVVTATRARCGRRFLCKDRHLYPVENGSAGRGW